MLRYDSERRIGDLAVEVFARRENRWGEPGELILISPSWLELANFADPKDRELVGALLAESSEVDADRYGDAAAAALRPRSRFSLGSDSRTRALLERLLRAGVLRFGDPEAPALVEDPGPAYVPELTLEEADGAYRVRLWLARGDERVSLAVPDLLLRAGWVFIGGTAARLEAERRFLWIQLLRKEELAPIPLGEIEEWVDAVVSDPVAPSLRLPESLRWRPVSLEPVPCAVLLRPIGDFSGGLRPELHFEYGPLRVAAGDPRSELRDRTERRVIRRDPARESAHLTRLKALLPAPLEFARIWERDVPAFAPTLLAEGWKVEVEGRPLRAAASARPKLSVSSGIDWFGIRGGLEFGDGAAAELPALLEASRRGQRFVRLGDGSQGVLPEEWLRRFATLAALGEEGASGIRFGRTQGPLLSAWIDEYAPGAEVDAGFDRLRAEIRGGLKLRPRSPARTFRGNLRPYQKEGLAWLDFLGRIGLGGILADDMGLGKTVQVLARLEAAHRREAPAGPRAKPDALASGPSLVVAPKSLLLNWQSEAARFAPRLRTLVYAGTEAARTRLRESIDRFDLVITTYGTLRQDEESLGARRFHYLIADEAQAIKNPDSLASRACRALRAEHRLAMTGTPIENSVEDLFALLDFVSPGLLGPGYRRRLADALRGDGDGADTSRRELARALRPFILRRTKAQVLADLPEKSEQVLRCELSPAERRRYAQLRDHYRAHLRGEIARRGMARSKIVVLEALLRLRQAACHPGLIDRAQARLPSAKLDILLERLGEVIGEGHRALVFSQFTSFLDIVGPALTRAGIAWSRIDGGTSARERAARVASFQAQGPEQVFLISLKAGGTGLNLTAADYVFLLDPWWNPAVEAQAIDRVHRIGQKNKVIAYRLIAQDTVEEKILELQATKRGLADALMGGEGAMLRGLSADDVEQLLS